LRPPAQGCDEGATLGELQNIFNPEGVAADVPGFFQTRDVIAETLSGFGKFFCA